MFGKTSLHKQRFKCTKCQKTFIWKERINKQHNEKHWFDLWVIEGYSIRQLCCISGYSIAKLTRIKDFWLNKEPPVLLNSIYRIARYLLFDGAYFHKKGYLIIIMDNSLKKVLHYAYIDKESYYNVYPILLYLKEQGLMPKAVTLDGHITIMKAIREIWPSIIMQRCLYHIQRQGLSWLRIYPKTNAGKALRILLNSLTNIKTENDKNIFLKQYLNYFP